MKQLRVLITNNTLDARAGTELYVYDLAVALLERGHLPVAYSNRLGQVASELHTACVPVIDQLDSLSVTPDIIHGHHHLEVMTALLHFPRTPAVLFCHSWRHWQEMPVRFPRIRRYAAMNQLTYNRLTCEHGIPEAQVEWIPNFVDMKRFQRRRALPEHPRRALIYSNHATDENFVHIVRAACDRAQLSLDVIGRGTSRPTSRPWEVLGQYDVVFASGRSALESLATGAAVVVCNQYGLGPMVTAAEVDELRRLNFGTMSTIGRAFDADEVLNQLARYSAIDAAEATSRIRAVAGLDATVDRLIGLYTDVITENQHAPPSAAEESRAAAAYLSQISDRIKSGGQVQALVDAELTEFNALRRADAAEQSSVQAELATIRKTLTWRLREHLLGMKVLMRIYRLARRRRH